MRMRILHSTLAAVAIAVASSAGAQAQVPGTQVPGTQVPGTQVPGTQVPGTEAARVITYIEVMPASVDTAVGILRRGAAASRKEAGNLRYEILQHAERRGALAVLEAWSDPKALAAHDDGAAAKVLRGELNPIRIGYYDQRLETAIDTGAAGAAGKDAIYVATHVDVTGQFKDDAIAMMRKLAAESRKQAGSDRFEIWQQNNRLNHFTMIEVWKDQGALDTHNASASARAFRDQLGHMMGALYDDRRYRSLD